MSQRLYLPQVPAAGERATLDKDRSHYLLRVLRLRLLVLLPRKSKATLKVAPF